MWPPPSDSPPLCRNHPLPSPPPQFVDNFAHLGGLVGGLLLGFALLIHRDGNGQVKCKQVTGAVLALFTFGVLLVGGFMLLYFRINVLAECPNCKYISCVPSPWWSCDVATDPYSLPYCAAPTPA